MTHDELITRVEALYGTRRGYIAHASREIGIAYSNFHQMIGGTRPIPAWIGPKLDEIAARREAALFSQEEIHLGVQAIYERARDAGWSDDDFRAAIRGWRPGKG